MGGVLDASGTMLPEIGARAAAAAAAARPLRECVFKAFSLKTKTKALLGEALVMSRLAFNAQVWAPLGKMAADAFGMRVKRLYRDIVGMNWSKERH